ncbi:hypothetical protein CMK20_03695 [Candidatus Poribacteria bacterium]|nr:hypothetical protein [Candidatus Poribacteria bacterium]
MPKTGGNGRSGRFLLSLQADWANTFDFLLLYWQQHQTSSPHPRSLKSINRNANQSRKPRSSHF